MSLIQLAIDRSRTILLILTFILIAGASTYITIPKESAPDVKIPIININYRHEGISPEDGERLIIRPIEQKVRSIEGVKEMRSTARENSGVVTLEFTAGFDSKKALEDVREKVDEAKADLPDDTDDPTVKEVSFSQFPVLVVHLSGSLPQRALFQIARDLRDTIEGNISAILEAKVVGDREEVVEIIIEPSKLEKYNIDQQQVITLFQSNNTLVSAGTIDNGKGRFSLKINGLLTSAEEVLNTPVTIFKGITIRFRDIAEIRRTFKDPIGFARLNGKSSIALEISKRTGENIIKTIEAVQTLVKEEQKYWPKNLKVDFSKDESNKIRDMLGDLENNVIAAVLLVMLVIIISLGWRSSLLVGIAVPGSFLMGILFIALQGHTINIVVLFALILSVGMLVDGAIIVAEYADQKMRQGMPPKEAFIKAAQRMAWPVITSIATIIVAFTPLLFWPGIIGQFMRFLPLTLIATLTGSIAMALIFLPTLGAIFGKAPEKKSSTKEPRYIRLYRTFLTHALERPGKTLGQIMGMVFVTMIAYGFMGNGVRFFPNIEPDNASIQVRARGNLSVHEKDALVKKVEQRILGMEEFKSIYTNTQVGSNSSKKSTPPPEDTIGTITLELADWQNRRKANVILNDVLERTKDIPGLIIQADEEKAGPPTGKPLHIEFSSRLPGKLLPTVTAVRNYINTLPGLKSIEDTRPVPGFQWAININREKAGLFGSNIAEIGRGIQLISNGIRIDTYRPDDSRDEVDITVRYPKEYRNLKQLENLFVRSQNGSVPISSFTTQSLVEKLDTINRVDGTRVYQISSELEPGVLASDILEAVQNWLEENPQDPSVHIKFKGESEDQKETSEFLKTAFSIALFMIFLILVTQFNSFFSAGLVLSAVFLSTIGVLIGLMITGRPFGIVMGGIGVIALGGIIVSNNIIFIDTFDYLKKTSTNIKKNILETGVTRIRPVLLTQITTVLGLVPMSLKLNIDFFAGEIAYDAPSSQWWVDLSTAIVFGVTFATVLTLVVTPCALMLNENIHQALKKDSLRNRLKRHLTK